jgi:hypothetical protein
LPTSSSIAAAKQKRKLLQKIGGEIGDDFVSLSLTKRVDQGPHPESRLVREEDELGEADDGVPLSNVNLFLTERWDLSRVCGVHQRAGTNCSWQKGSESRSEETEGGDGELDR